MKTCPFCAEEIQDAAIVCKHCHRDLPAAVSAPPAQLAATKSHLLPWLICSLAVLAALMALPSFMSGLQRGTLSSDGPCVLNAIAAPAPDVIARIEKADESTRVIAIRNRGPAHWTDATVTIRGLGMQAMKGQPTGPHSLRLTSVGAGELVAKNIVEFKKADGSAWIPMMMRPTEVVVGATMNGRACSFEQQFAE
jgi:hypothetical protein